MGGCDGAGVLRLRKIFTSWSSCSAQDDSSGLRLDIDAVVLIYSPLAGGSALGCKLDSLEIAATIIPDRNCMVATSCWSKALGMEDRTSNTPRVRRKWRSGATSIERTPRWRQVARSTLGLNSVSGQSRTS